MPYIKQKDRAEIQEGIEQLVFDVKNSSAYSPFKCAGQLNYIITQLINALMQPDDYNQMNSVVGMLECCKQEFYRRACAIYEDQKAFENGDVYT